MTVEPKQNCYKGKEGGNWTGLTNGRGDALSEQRPSGKFSLVPDFAIRQLLKLPIILNSVEIFIS